MPKTRTLPVAKPGSGIGRRQAVRSPLSRDGLIATAMIEASLKSLAEHRPVKMDELLG